MLADRTLRLAAAFVVSLALSACGSTDRIVPSAKATPVDVASVPATVYPAPTTKPPATTAAPTGGATASATPSKAAGNVVLATAGNTFEPATLTVKVGTKVTFQNEGGVHSANSGDGRAAKVDPAGPIQSEIGFQKYEVTFTKAGTFPYFCQPHATLGMLGEIVVE